MPKTSPSGEDNPIQNLMFELRRLLIHPLRERKAKLELPLRLKALMIALIQQLSVAMDNHVAIHLSLDKELITALLIHEELAPRSVCLLHLIALIDPSFHSNLLKFGVVPFVFKLIQPTIDQALRSEAIGFFLTLANQSENTPFLIEHDGVSLLLLIAVESAKNRQLAVLKILHGLTSMSKEAAQCFVRAHGIQQLLALSKRIDPTLHLLTLQIIENVHLLDEALETFGPDEIASLLQAVNCPILEVEAEACVILANLLDSKKLRELTEKQGGIPILVSRIDTPFPLLQKTALAALTHLGLHDSENRLAITKAGALPKIADLLLDEGLCISATKALGILSILQTNALAILSTTTAVQKLFELLKSNNPDLVVETINALLQIVDNCPHISITDSIISQLLHLMSSDNPQLIRQRALLLLIHFDTTSFLPAFLRSGGLELLLNIITKEANYVLKGHALLKCKGLTCCDEKNAKKISTTLVDLGAVDALCDLLTHPITVLSNRATLTLIQMMFHCPSIHFSLTVLNLPTFLDLLSHKDLSIQHLTTEALLNLSKVVDNAKALRSAGGLPLLMNALSTLSQRDRASLALINIASHDSSDLNFGSLDKYRSLVPWLKHDAPKFQKRAARAFANLSGLPEHVAFIAALNQHLLFITLLRNPDCAGFARVTLDCIARLSQKMKRNIALYEYALNGTIDGIIPQSEQPIEPTSPPVSDNTLRKRLKIEKKAAKHAQDILNHQTEITELSQALGEEVEPFHPVEGQSLRITKSMLLKKLEHLKERSSEVRRLERIKLADASLRSDALIEELYNASPKSQAVAAQMLLAIGKEGLVSTLPQKIGEEHCRQLISYATDELRSHVKALFEFLYPGVMVFDSVLPCPALKQTPQIALIFEVREQLLRSEGVFFESITPCLVGSQARRVQQNLAFDERRDWDFELFCFSKHTINPASIKELLLAHILPAKTRFSYWNSHGCKHELGFQLVHSIDIKFSIYAEWSQAPDVLKCVQESQYGRRLTNRAAVVDLIEHTLYAYDPRFRGFTNKVHELTPHDHGYALVDLALEKIHIEEEERCSRLLNEPHLRMMLSRFFQQTTDAAAVELQKSAISYASKHLRDKLKCFRRTSESPLVETKKILHRVLKDLDIDLPAPILYASKVTFFQRSRMTQTDASATYVLAECTG